MFAETKKVITLAALIVATGIAGVELTRNPAQADPALVVGGAPGYAGERVDTAFELAASLPAATFAIPVAPKGDMLPIGCADPFLPEVAAECMDSAYELEAEPVVVVETLTGEASSTLTRMVGFTMAGY